MFIGVLNTIVLDTSDSPSHLEATDRVIQLITRNDVISNVVMKRVDWNSLGC